MLASLAFFDRYVAQLVDGLLKRPGLEDFAASGVSPKVLTSC